MGKFAQRSKQISKSKDFVPKPKNNNLIPIEGVVTENVSNLRFIVKVNDEYSINAYLSGKLNQRSIKVLVGDRVKVEVTPYDLSMGRIVYRYNN